MTKKHPLRSTTHHSYSTNDHSTATTSSRNNPIPIKHVQPQLLFTSSTTTHDPTTTSPSPTRPNSLTKRDSPSRPSIKLLTATFSDIPVLARIHISAYTNDQLLRLQHQGKDPSVLEQEMVAEWRRRWPAMEKGGLWAIKAIVDDEVVGCAIWGINDRERKGGNGGHEDGQGGLEEFWALRAGMSEVVERREEMGRERATETETGTKSLAECAREKLRALHMRWVGDDVRFMYLGSLAVSLTHQSQGIGSALLHHGMERADSEGLLIWLEATPAGHPVYEHFGWKTVDSESMDLAEWAGRDAGFGVYRWWGCLRMPLLRKVEG